MKFYWDTSKQLQKTDKEMGLIKVIVCYKKLKHAHVWHLTKLQNCNDVKQINNINPD